MFTGIIEELGIIRQITNSTIEIQCNIVLDGIKCGDSIAVNGVCLTVTAFNKIGFTADISPETYRITALGSLESGDFVNLERAMLANGRFGGHVVSGHVDGTAKFLSVVRNQGFYDVQIELSPEQAMYVVKKGSISVDGISLTTTDIKDTIIKLAIIPHTYENTNLKILKSGDYVNIETDIFAKYIEKFLSRGDNKSEIDFDFLQANGF